MTYKDSKASKHYLNINIDGNHKLVNTEAVRFMIWNIPSVATCPYATEKCKKNCYAKKAENLYPSCVRQGKKIWQWQGVTILRIT